MAIRLKGIKSDMSDWSKYFQTPDFLEATRLMSLEEDMLPLIIKWIGIKPGMKILDVGCGTGAFTFYLARGVENCEFVGVDMDDLFLEKAKEKLDRNSTCSNCFEFLKGDALNLQFKEDYFDIVVSHTFLTNMQKPVSAIKEMMRVGKTGGIVASITAQSLINIPLHPGFYPVDTHDYYTEWMELYIKVWKMYNALYPMKDFLSDVDPVLIPKSFANAGLWGICMHSIGKGVSLSNAAISDEDKQLYIEAQRKAERQKFKAFKELEGFEKHITMEEAQRYQELVEIRHDALLKDVGENAIWEWTGGANILMTGVIPPTMKSLYKLQDIFA
jgi:ubiquinone/menaquinone biosynthesis C-methylase UbiE